MVKAKMNPHQFFKDKVIIITGASSGIGRMAALTLARLNSRIVLVARNEEKLIQLQEEIHASGGQALVIKADVSSCKDIEKMTNQVIAEWGRMDIVIANAGQYIQGYFQDIQIDEFEKSMAVNFFGAVNLIKSVLPVMHQAGKGHIVIVSSLDAKKGIVGDGPYVVAKAALQGLGDVLRQELYGTGIFVTTVYPGRVDTPMIKHISVPWISPKISPEKVVKAIINGIKKRKAIVVVPAIYRPLGALNDLFPRMVDWFYRILKIEGTEI